MTTTTLSSKGQLVIPRYLRQRLALMPGDRLRCDIEDGRLVLIPEERGQASVDDGDDGLPVLRAPKDAPEITPDLIREVLSD